MNIYSLLSIIVVCISCCIFAWLRNKPRVIEVPYKEDSKGEPKECRHSWNIDEVLDRADAQTGALNGRLYVRICSKCKKVDKQLVDYFGD